ncbi:MAG: hypothetical protein JRI71_16025, partial [Deltaproteobacteria bacterium]|nr:hypothetical protein [Deltaproteobacteria bacterium]
HSGQRVRVELIKTRLSDAFRNIAATDLFPPLSKVHIGLRAQNTIVDLYFRNIPEFVDVAEDEPSNRITVNMFWDRQRKGDRIGILDHRFGRLRPIHHGAAAERLISSEYKGRWIDFFSGFEWKPEWDLPPEFSLPPTPTALVLENRGLLPDALVETVAAGRWEEAETRTKALFQGDIGWRRVDGHRWVLAESLLRRNRHQEAMETLHQVPLDPEKPRISAWRTYLQVHALAAASEYHQAVRLAEKKQEAVSREKDLASWFFLLKAEIYLAMGEPEQALRELDRNIVYPEAARNVVQLRRGDAYYDKGETETAFALYRDLSSDLRFMQRHPYSLARWFALLYRKRQYESAYRYGFLLSDTLKRKSFPLYLLADYWTAMTRFRAGDLTRARLMLWEIEEAGAATEAGLRARLKLMDLDVVGKPKPDFSSLRDGYEAIIEIARQRQIREEAFFKQILVYHLSGNNLGAVRQLGRFFDSYWAGELLPEAQALFVEIFPAVAQALVRQGAYFETLSLVTKHRHLLVQARITSDFLYDLAESYIRVGLVDQAISTYLYLMDFEKNERKQRQIYLPLIRAYDHKGDYEQVRHYASEYLSRYPEGSDRMDVLYYFARSLAETGKATDTARMLRKNKWPVHEKIDRLAGELFFDQGEYKPAACYLARAESAADEETRQAMIFKRAEALFFQEKWSQAATVYASLLTAKGYKGQAFFRLIQSYLNAGADDKALNLYRRLSDMEIEDPWQALSARTMEIHRKTKQENKNAHGRTF